MQIGVIAPSSTRNQYLGTGLVVALQNQGLFAQQSCLNRTHQPACSTSYYYGLVVFQSIQLSVVSNQCSVLSHFQIFKLSHFQISQPSAPATIALPVP